MGLSWKRMKKSLKNKRDQKRFEEAKNEIKKFLNAHEKGDIKLFYFDQSGFSLDPTVPYAWQEKGRNIELSASKGGHLNVIGMLSPDNEMKSIILDGKMDSEIIINCFESFFKNKKKTSKWVIIIDNAPIHSSDDFQVKVEEWRARGIEFYFLPPYSPELNKIEILWRFIKHSWLPFEAYEDKEALMVELGKVLGSIGVKYRINFNA